MDELVKQVAQKTGIGEDQARQAAETVLAFLKAKLPAPIAGQIEGYLQGSGEGISGMADNLGGFKKVS